MKEFSKKIKINFSKKIENEFTGEIILKEFGLVEKGL